MGSFDNFIVVLPNAAAAAANPMSLKKKKSNLEFVNGRGRRSDQTKTIATTIMYVNTSHVRQLIVSWKCLHYLNMSKIKFVIFFYPLSTQIHLLLIFSAAIFQTKELKRSKSFNLSEFFLYAKWE